MTRQNYADLTNRLGGLNRDELILLRNRINKLLASQTNHKTPNFITPDGDYVEVKTIKKKRKDGPPKEYQYEYYRWREGKTVKSEYIGPVGTWAKMQAQGFKAIRPTKKAA